MDDLHLADGNLSLPDDASELQDRYQKIILAVSDGNSGQMYDDAKTLLETTFRTIITNRNGEVVETPDRRASFVELYRQTISTFEELECDSKFLPIVKKSITVVADMRDNYGERSHGQDGYTERQQHKNEALLISRLAISLSDYLFKRHRLVSSDNENKRLNYNDNPDFNDLLDEEGDVEVAGINTAARSRVLFDYDLTAYREKLIEFKNDQDLDAYEQEMEAAADLYAEMQSDIARGK